MYAEVMRVLQVEMGWGMTEQNPTEDYGSLRHEFAEIDGRATVTLTQPTQIRKLAEAIFGSERADVPETLLPLPAAWSAVASALMSASWISQTRFDLPAVSLLACRGQRPTQVDMEAVRSHAAYLWTTRDIGLTYYEGPKDADIRKTVRLRLFSDDGEEQHLDGAGHWGMLVYRGSEEDCPGTAAVLATARKRRGWWGSRCRSMS